MHFNAERQQKEVAKHAVILIFLSQVTKEHMQFNIQDQLILSGKAAYVSCYDYNPCNTNFL